VHHTACDYLDGSYLEQNPDWHVSDSAWKARQVLKMLRRHRIAPKTVYDIGCGAGEVLRQLQEGLDRSCQLFGSDVSPQAIELSKKRENRRLHFTLGTHREYTGEPFDLVMAIDVVEHAEDYRGFLREIRPLGEYKIIHLPLGISAQTAWRRGALKRRRKHHVDLHYFTEETARFALTDLGYEVLDGFYTPRSIDICVGTGEKLLRLPRKLLFAVNPGFTVRVFGGYSLLLLAK
jgi:SAM-dependent methyltransferase